MVIGIDNGNKQTKTKNAVFVSGIVESPTRPGFGSDILHYKGKYYILSDKRKGYQRDKTKDETAFILTLFGIAKEIRASGMHVGAGETIPVTLLIGLPPAHYGMMHKAFRQYFLNRGPIEFELDGQPFRIRIDDAFVFVQGLGAMMTVYSQIKGASDACVIDIGGFTVDYLPVHSGRPVVSACDSLELGVTKMYNSIKSKVSAGWDLLLTEDSVDTVLMGKQSELPADVKNLIRAKADEYVAEIISELRERDIDLRTVRPVFCGGGAVLLKERILGNPRIGSSAIVVDDLAANCKGYEILYKASHPNEI